MINLMQRHGGQGLGTRDDVGASVLSRAKDVQGLTIMVAAAVGL